MVHFQHRLLTSSKSLFFELKVKCPFFHFLDLNGRLYLKRPKFTLFLDFFSLNPLHNFGIPGPDLRIHNAVRLGWDNVKIDSQHAVKKKLDLAKK